MACEDIELKWMNEIKLSASLLMLRSNYSSLSRPSETPSILSMQGELAEGLMVSNKTKISGVQM